MNYSREEFLESQVHSVQLEIDKLKPTLERLQSMDSLTGPEFMLLSETADKIETLEAQIKELYDEYREEEIERDMRYRL